MGLFDKKICDICSEKIGLLGNRKLEDGNICKDCAKKLSPFFSDRRRSTLEEIKGQLNYREQNRRNLSAFSPSMCLGENEKVYIDTAKSNFIISRNTPRDWDEENPDIIPISSVLSCNLRIDEDRDEIYYEGNDGQQLSYNPPRYNFSYDFYIEMNVNHPYFDEISIKLNNFSVEGMGTVEYNNLQQTAMQIIGLFNNGSVNNGCNNGFSPVQTQQYPNASGSFNMNGYQQNTYVQQPNQYTPQQNMYQQNTYQQPNQFSQQNTFMNNQQQFNQQFNQPQQNSWICPVCSQQNYGKFCSNCGRSAF